MFLILLIAMALAVFVGIKSERARQAHANWQSYKDRIATMRGERMRETARAAFGVALLVTVLVIGTHL